MKVMLDDEYDWMLLRNDGRIFDTMGNEVKWIPIGKSKHPEAFELPMNSLRNDAKWNPIEEEPIIEDNSGGNKSQTQSTEEKDGSRKS